MNNSFTQKAQHYLNESYRLTKELDTQIQYSGILEAVLEELVGTEDFLEIMEIYIPKPGVSATHKVKKKIINGEEVSIRVPRTDAEKQRYAGHLGKIMDIRDRATSTVQSNAASEPNGKRDVAITKAKNIRSRSQAALIAHGGKPGFDGNHQAAMLDTMDFDSDGASRPARAYIGQRQPATQHSNFIPAGENELTTAIDDHKLSAAMRNRSTGAAGRAQAENKAKRGQSISVGPRGPGGTPRPTYTGPSKGKQGLLFPKGS